MASEDFSSAIRESDLVFWSRQLSEHTLFLHLGLEVEPLKSYGDKLHQLWENFRATFPDETFQGDVESLLTFNYLSEQTKDYKINTLNFLTDCIKNADAIPRAWLGWIFPTFAEHVIRELNFAQDKANGRQISPQDEINFWRIINKEHALFDAHLLDPSEADLIKTAYQLAEKIEGDQTCESRIFVKISLDAIKELDKYHLKGKSLLNNNQVRSIIHPALLTHVIREGQRSIDRITKLSRCVNVLGDDYSVFDDFSEIECNKDNKLPQSLSVEDRDCCGC